MKPVRKTIKLPFSMEYHFSLDGIYGWELRTGLDLGAHCLQLVIGNAINEKSLQIRFFAYEHRLKAAKP